MKNLLLFTFYFIFFSSFSQAPQKKMVAVGDSYQGGCAQAGIAARMCSDLDQNGYSDWYLPSKDELNKLYINRFKIVSFTDAFYWSSCESDGTYAWGKDFYDGTQGRVSKDSAGHVNAVRAF